MGLGPKVPGVTGKLQLGFGFRLGRCRVQCVGLFTVEEGFDSLFAGLCRALKRT